MKLNWLMIACVLAGVLTATATYPDAPAPLWEIAHCDLPLPPGQIDAGAAEPALLVAGSELVRTPREYLDIAVRLHAQKAVLAWCLGA